MCKRRKHLIHAISAKKNMQIWIIRRFDFIRIWSKPQTTTESFRSQISWNLSAIFMSPETFMIRLLRSCRLINSWRASPITFQCQQLICRAAQTPFHDILSQHIKASHGNDKSAENINRLDNELSSWRSWVNKRINGSDTRVHGRNLTISCCRPP